MRNGYVKREMPMHRSLPRLRLALVLAMLSTLTLTACEHLTQMRASSIQTQAGDARPVACVVFEVIHYSVGKPNLTVADVKAQAARDNPLGRVRNYVGDTKQTIEQAKAHNAAWHSLCDPKEK